MKKLHRPSLPPNRQGIALDVATILLNLSLVPLFTSRVGALFDESFKDNREAFKVLAILMLVILAGRLVGLYLKRFPLQARLTTSQQTRFQVYFLLLNVPVLILTAAFGAVLVMNVLASTGVVGTNSSGLPDDSQAIGVVVPVAILCLTGLEVYLLYRLSRPLNAKEKLDAEKENWRFGWKGEILADFGLFAYMAVWQVFHNQTVAIMLTPADNVDQTLGLKIFGLVFSLFSFLLFYLSPRTVFLIEDRRYPITWLFILLVFMSSIVPYM